MGNRNEERVDVIVELIKSMINGHLYTINTNKQLILDGENISGRGTVLHVSKLLYNDPLCPTLTYSFDMWIVYTKSIDALYVTIDNDTHVSFMIPTSVLLRDNVLTRLQIVEIGYIVETILMTNSYGGICAMGEYTSFEELYCDASEEEVLDDLVTWCNTHAPRYTPPVKERCLSMNKDEMLKWLYELTQLHKQNEYPLEFLDAALDQTNVKRTEKSQ